MNESKRMNKSELTCCWLPDTATQELSKPGMSEGDKRMWTDRNGCKELATWNVRHILFPDEELLCKSCSKHLAELCAKGVNTVWPLEKDLSKSTAESIEAGGSGTGAFILIVDPHKLKASGGTGSSTAVYNHLDDFELVPSSDSRSTVSLSSMPVCLWRRVSGDGRSTPLIFTATPHTRRRPPHLPYSRSTSRPCAISTRFRETKAGRMASARAAPDDVANRLTSDRSHSDRSRRTPLRGHNYAQVTELLE